MRTNAFGKTFSIFVGGLVAFALHTPSIFSAEDKPIHCYVGGTMRPPMEKIADLYQKNTGKKVELDFGDSGANMIKAEMTGKGDLCVAHDPFPAVMICKGLATKAWLAANLHPVIIVPKGNPKGIKGTKDLARPGLKVVLTDKIYSTMGYICSAILKKAGVEDAVEINVVNRPRSGGDAANAVILGHADVAMAWSAVAVLRNKDVDFIEVEKEYRLNPKVDTITGATFSVVKDSEKTAKNPVKWPDIDLSRIRVIINLLKSSEQPEESAKFAEFAVSDDTKKIWAEFGFDIPEETVRLMTDKPATEKKN